MVNQSRGGDGSETIPSSFPEVTPRDLYPTSDIRFVMLRIGELTTKVDTLISSVDKHGDKIDDLRHKVSFVKGAMWVIAGLLGFLVLAVGWYFSGKLSVTINP